jgi:hypothetical protein
MAGRTQFLVLVLFASASTQASTANAPASTCNEYRQGNYLQRCCLYPAKRADGGWPSPPDLPPDRSYPANTRSCREPGASPKREQNYYLIHKTFLGLKPMFEEFANEADCIAKCPTEDGRSAPLRRRHSRLRHRLH